MKVLKFGGSSLKPLQAFIECCNITRQQCADETSVTVVSALGGVTNRLQTALNNALTGENTIVELESITEQHQQRLEQLHKTLDNFEHQACQQTLVEQLNRLEQLLTGVQLVKDASLSTRCRILAMGERLSSILFYYAAKAIDSRDITLLDSANLIKTISGVQPSDYLEASFDEDACHRLIKPLSKTEQPTHYIAAGFVSSNEEGEITLLGRNGSDLSAAIYAAALSADELQIWSDVEGIYNADPNRVSRAQVIEQLSYQEAMELSFFGAKVLHPKTIAPIASYRIPTRIKNTFKPDDAGTLITSSSNPREFPLAGITMLDDLAMLTLSGVDLKGHAGLAERVFQCISREGVSIILISQSSSEYAISFCVNQSDVSRAKRALNREFALEMKHHQVDPVDVRESLSSITVVGDHMKQTHGIAAKLFSALAAANVNIVAIAQDSSERSISAVIRQAKSKVALNKTYEYFFQCPRVISAVLYGVGTIGDELLSQIKQQQNWLLQQRIDLRVIAIANSKQLLWHSDGISLDNWRLELDNASTPSSIEQLQSLITQERPLNPVFIDCTSNDQLAECYPALFEQGLHIVAANKKANTLSHNYYLTLREKAQQSLKQFAYETNVGAGLPVIANIQNQVRSGDSLLSFDGILSGSLSYIMGKLDDGLSFSQAVLEAKQKGFTEPDPRDDLSGMDVARKLLIIAREFGATQELTDIEIEPLISDELNDAKTIDDFLQRLPEMDTVFEEKIKQAKQQQKVLRLAGVINDQGKMAVQLLAVDASHPLYSIRDGENAFSFTTARYHPVPLVIRGYGAGADVTAAGVFGDILKTVVA
ncbi:bifunctional aspartate kinase/homoserine dehydrogenase I [Pleionea mediterranea]|uniref:Bifunctional aspartokinase/homoserine dehydrogenase n=1 Tax=Pleionea mediterranea TaxID=523701 RepID=A0A316FHL0_9GAMM|nr:bifunctional aspartate kinase/homoserine dehydrogenase I [Pleionea mediterranea]PWK47300.1 aspartate kinase [Pleionea mediterranea]